MNTINILQRHSYITGLLVVLFLVSNSANGWSFDELRQDKSNVLLGFFAGIAVHELGHISAATLKKTDFRLDGLSITYPDPALTAEDRLELASAGFQFQWAAAELAFRYLNDEETETRTRHRAAGIVLSHLAITAAYMTVLKHHTHGDIEGMSRATGISNDRLALAVAVPAILDGWRLFGKTVPKWVPTASVVSKGIGITWVWTY